MKLILLHGLGQTSQSWQEVIEQLGGDIDIETPNLFDWCGDEKITFQTIYQGLEHYLDQFTEPFYLGGISLGGMLALQYVTEHAEKVRALVLIGARASMPKRLMTLQHVLMRFVPNSAFEKLGMEKKRMLALSQSTVNLDLRHHLPHIICPVCVIVGGKDRANKVEAIRLSQRLPHAELHIVQQAGHAVNTEKAAECAQAIDLFLRVTLAP